MRCTQIFVIIIYKFLDFHANNNRNPYFYKNMCQLPFFEQWFWLILIYCKAICYQSLWAYRGEKKKKGKKVKKFTCADLLLMLLHIPVWNILLPQQRPTVHDIFWKKATVPTLNLGAVSARCSFWKNQCWPHFSVLPKALKSRWWSFKWGSPYQNKQCRNPCTHLVKWIPQIPPPPPQEILHFWHSSKHWLPWSPPANL